MKCLCVFVDLQERDSWNENAASEKAFFILLVFSSFKQNALLCDSHMQKFNSSIFPILWLKLKYKETYKEIQQYTTCSQK